MMGTVKGRAGGLARAKKLTAAERSAIARKAANTRWAPLRRKKKDGPKISGDV